MTNCADCNERIFDGSGRRKRCHACAEKRTKELQKKWVAVNYKEVV